MAITNHTTSDKISIFLLEVAAPESSTLKTKGDRIPNKINNKNQTPEKIKNLSGVD
jgi:hypothetical protein